MTHPPSEKSREQRLLRNARREGLVIMAVWAAALLWSVGSGVLLGYRRSAQKMQLIFGMPDWVFWSVVLPWALCFLFSIWFCFAFMADDDLGQDPEERPPHA
jgi:hypothetical protein